METYEFTIEEVVPFGYKNYSDFWQPGENRSEPYAEHHIKYHYFYDAVKKSGMTWYVENYKEKGLIVTMLKNENGAYFPESVRVSDATPLTFEQIYRIEMEKAKGPDKEYEFWEPEYMPLLQRCADIYAKRYHDKMMRDLKNIDLFL